MGLHHVLFEPFVVILCAQADCGLELGRSCVIVGVQTMVCQAICRFATPLEVSHPKERDRFYYMNMNLCYEAFRDVKIEWIKRHDRAVPLYYLPWMLWIWNLGNLLLFVPMSGLLCFFLRSVFGVPGAKLSLW